jgi:hypothetical protein
MLRVVKKGTSFDHPVGFAAPIEDVRAPVSIRSLKCTFGNISIGGTSLQVAFIAATIVTFITV